MLPGVALRGGSYSWAPRAHLLSVSAPSLTTAPQGSPSRCRGKRHRVQPFRQMAPLGAVGAAASSFLGHPWWVTRKKLYDTYYWECLPVRDSYPRASVLLDGLVEVGDVWEAPSFTGLPSAPCWVTPSFAGGNLRVPMNPDGFLYSPKSVCPGHIPQED